MKRKRWIQYSIIVVLAVLPFIMWEMRKRGERGEEWYYSPVEDAVVKVVPIPADTQGAYGFMACVSPDGTKIAVAGNVAGYQNFFEPALFANGVAAPEWQKPLKAFLKNIYWTVADTTQSDFQQIDKKFKIRSIMAMAFSNTSPQRLAYISREFAGELPSDFERQDPNDIPSHVWQMVKETYKITSEHNERGGKTPLFFYVLYVTPIEGGEPKAITLVNPKRNEAPRLRDMRFHVPGHIHIDMDTFSLCWANDDKGLYYKDSEGISFVSLDGEEKRIYSLGEGRIFFSKLRGEKNGSVSFIERNDLEIAEIPQEGGADELITIDRTGRVLSRRKIAEGNQWYIFHEGVPQAALGRTKWAFATPEVKKKDDGTIGWTPGKYIISVASLQSPFYQEIRQFRVSFDHKMPFFCTMVGFNADETQLWFTKKFASYEVKDLNNYRSDAPFSELVIMDIK